jgi:methyltransferase family protein
VTRPPGFQDLFSRDSAGYAKFRPRYPAALFDWLAGLPASRRLAWDCATGNGQAATLLAERFEQVVGSDASLAQLRAARRAPRVGYVASLAESSALAGGSVDLATIAQALHWLELPRFYAEVDRVAAPGAALAIWGYARLTAPPGIQATIRRFHEETLGPYWPIERKLVEEGYRSFQIPIREVVPPPFTIEARLNLPALLGYLRTWSAVGNYIRANGRDPVAELEPELAAAWGDPAVLQPIVWPLFVRAGRWR